MSSYHKQLIMIYDIYKQYLNIFLKFSIVHYLNKIIHKFPTEWI